jgi:hypothetical protein
MSALSEYVKKLVQKADKTFLSGEIFAKVLTKNDDSGRHGVCVPADVYSYFPELHIPDDEQNFTDEFNAFDCLSQSVKSLAYKYYQRYPERRITRLPSILNDVDSDRILVFIYAKHSDGTSGYYLDCASSKSGRFQQVFDHVFGASVEATSGKFIVRPVDSLAFVEDENLKELLARFDGVKAKGWIETLRSGHTGIGYTFETLIDIEENNDQIADFRGIEIKCKGVREGFNSSNGKLNLFQKSPVWFPKMSGIDRLRMIGTEGDDGLFSLYSQVTTSPNNLDLRLDIATLESKINLKKLSDPIGYWSMDSLKKRLFEKHARAVFVKAHTKSTKSKTMYFYDELVYCDTPCIQRFVDLVAKRHIVFEFIQSEKRSFNRRGVLKSSVRNHGYPWRLNREELLDQLFGFQIKLR